MAVEAPSTWVFIVQAAEFLADPVKVTIGSADLSASHSVSQVRMETSDLQHHMSRLCSTTFHWIRM